MSRAQLSPKTPLCMLWCSFLRYLQIHFFPAAFDGKPALRRLRKMDCHKRATFHQVTRLSKRSGGVQQEPYVRLCTSQCAGHLKLAGRYHLRQQWQRIRHCFCAQIGLLTAFAPFWGSGALVRLPKADDCARSAQSETPSKMASLMTLKSSFCSSTPETALEPFPTA